MCGIAGIYSLLPEQKIDMVLLSEMTKRVHHRGSQDEGYLAINIQKPEVRAFYVEDSIAAVKAKLYPFDAAWAAQIGFGFQRLPTLELTESGHQPMYDAKLDLAIIFNGEIYNHNELRVELEKAGYSFRGHSDTEVILKAYHYWGMDCVHRFVGMWAISIWDQKQGLLFLSRDRFGIKPLYYAIDKGYLYWGSEIKQILAAPIDKAQNKAMIWRSMKVNSMMVYDEETHWQHIHALKPGHNMIVKGGKTEIRQYYQLDTDSFERSTLSFDEAKDEYLQLFMDSLKLQLHSDVEVGSSLSGGLDSSAIACMAAPLLDYPLRTFSIYYEDDPALDERSYIEIVAAKNGIQTNYSAPQAQDALDWWEKATYLNDLPVSSGFVSQYALMKMVNEASVHVLLSGQGSDEISGGYRHATYRYYADLIRSLRVGRFAGEIKHFLSANPLQSMGNLAKIAMSVALPESTLYALEARHYRFDPFSKEYAAQAKAMVEGKFMQQISDIPVSRLSSFLYNMMHNTSLMTLLHCEDRMSMGNGVESRMPFLDHRLVELVFSLPAAYKIRPPYRKVFHRKAFQGYVPQEISERKDKGIFGSPFYSRWMRGELKDFMQDILYSREFRSRGIWDLPLVHQRWRGFLAGKNRDAEMLYNVISLELWHRVFNQ
ncbi:MAG: asparagine synthase (glutamine-hydrolyzing) [Candidatus Cloacimonadaceae bacterium]|jgi:asparagine synthase (glutamine-hydrolysing)|nr:asparagine synthase (glutamine-hydrolyzing) [Candidatus Cloacimonadota bacterium]MCB5255813.1 asparagine synthase (glutamine-hydrolyzing) [Candidatus Cloacimonadota bacterium]MCK9178068.1 asparagine synthase (glutamine-hydrolyzing) [Candidatus Cloacimonadota bacterium]MCK9242304.1 asparagine synthase (glutamine-hydrolyzing) [Candidatus Cloacimonadota bacterium]MDY0127762.1 asparagine synthase (glutamine-hydrolyzing) [Candidatus Cloacimonadaceae bacterium]